MNSTDNSTAEAGKRFSTQPDGHLLGKVGLAIIGICFILAAWYNQFAIAILLGLVLAATGLSKLWSPFSLSHVSCQRFLSEHRAFPGEHIELKLQLENRKLLPLPWIQIDDEVPAGFVPGTVLVPGSRPGFGYLSKTASLLWYTRINWRQHHFLHKIYFNLD